VEKGGKVLLDASGYRLWFDYATDHYKKPYGEFALISPSGAWPHEWPISTSFNKADDVKGMALNEGINPQIKSFFMSNTYLYGLTKLIAKKIDFDKALFSMIEYPVVTEAIFSMEDHGLWMSIRDLSLVRQQKNIHFQKRKRRPCGDKKLDRG
jgi:hypothetical protein